jgi:hypothetical protein
VADGRTSRTGDPLAPETGSGATCASAASMPQPASTAAIVVAGGAKGSSIVGWPGRKAGGEMAAL